MSERYFAIERLARELLELLDSAEVSSNGDLPTRQFDAMYDYVTLQLRRKLEPATEIQLSPAEYAQNEADYMRKAL